MAVGFFFKVYIANIIGADLLGVFALGLTSIAIAGVFAGLGFDASLVRFVSKYVAAKEALSIERYVNNTLLVVLLVSCFLGLLFFLFSDFIAGSVLKEQGLAIYLPWFALLLVVGGIGTVAERTIRGLQEVKKSSIITNFLRLPLKIGLCVGFIALGFGLKGYIWAETIAYLTSLALMFWLIKHLAVGWKITPRFKLSFTSEERKYAFNMLAINAVGLLQWHGDKILLVYFLSASDLGIYYIILSISTFVPTILVSVNSIFTPIISQLKTEKKMTELKEAFQNTARYVFVLSFPLVLFLCIYSSQILSYFGPEFVAGSSLLIMVVCGELISLSFGSVGVMLKMMGHERQMRNVTITSSIVSFGLYYFFISSMGFLGLGLAYVLGKLLINILASIVLFRKTSFIVLNKKYAISIALFLTLSIAFYFISTMFATTGTSIGTLLVMFVFCYLFFFITWRILIGKKDIAFLKAEFKSIKK